MAETVYEPLTPEPKDWVRQRKQMLNESDTEEEEETVIEKTLTPKPEEELTPYKPYKGEGYFDWCQRTKNPRLVTQKDFYMSMFVTQTIEEIKAETENLSKNTKQTIQDGLKPLQGEEYFAWCQRTKNPNCVARREFYLYLFSDNEKTWKEIETEANRLTILSTEQKLDYIPKLGEYYESWCTRTQNPNNVSARGFYKALFRGELPKDCAVINTEPNETYHQWCLRTNNPGNVTAQEFRAVQLRTDSNEILVQLSKRQPIEIDIDPIPTIDLNPQPGEDYSEWCKRTNNPTKITPEEFNAKGRKLYGKAFQQYQLEKNGFFIGTYQDMFPDEPVPVETNTTDVGPQGTGITFKPGRSERVKDCWQINDEDKEELGIDHLASSSSETI